MIANAPEARMEKQAPVITSDRLILRQAEPQDVPEILRYYAENREHLAPYDPVRPSDFYTERFWYEQIHRNHVEFQTDQTLRLFLFRRDEPQRVIGTVNFTAILRGPAQYCNLGYGLAAREVGKGYMIEILPPAIAYVFEELNLHRIQANYMPHNQRSGAVLKRLGFVIEGVARDYIFINGAWRDHVLTSLTHPDWRPRA